MRHGFLKCIRIGGFISPCVSISEGYITNMIYIFLCDPRAG